MTGRFRGHAEARIDDNGRLKMPSHFKKALEAAYGRSLFVTALTDEYLHIYPMPVWEEVESRVRNLGMMHPARHRFLTRVNRFGQEVEMDNQGRLLIKPAQRELVRIKDQVVVIGCIDHLQLWAAEGLDQGQGTQALTADDFSMLEI
ncbi:MAG: division/cell wall cluster transcriptional repressor MraZ [Acidobacteria bacterium]|nr:division/cell wall cluster transcriptional repressor MraZ [Acidobacteriota bacterium]MCB9396564.1 division/cell wall cluster transcriptional repressor MraZ [Acidobacteriota bacterium]